MVIRRLFIASKNSGKIAELVRMLPNGLAKTLPIDDERVPDVEEVGSTFLENAKIKAESVINFIDDETAVLGDDSGLCIDALGGRPGIYSSRYADGDYGAAMDRILSELRGIGQSGRGAHLSCVLYLVANDGSHHAFPGEVHGTIALSRRGHGMGYSPIFVPDGCVRTFGEMSPEEKDKISHRRVAVEKLLNWLALANGENANSTDN
jgi:XTP/dITP diphosphohydrolase